jgi:hypothetical protein
MDIDISELIVRYLQRPGEDSARHRVLRTAALFLKREEGILELLRKGGQLDGELVRDIAALASPIETAVLLAEFAPHLPVDCFLTLFNQVHESTTDTRALRELAEAASLYYNWHPGSIDVPPDLAERLLRSPDEDARLMGLKVLRRFYRDPSALLKSALAALEHGTDIERCGAAHELIRLCDDPAHRFLSALDDGSVAKLRERLEAASQHDADRYTRENAEVALRLLGSFEAGKTKAPSLA